MIGWVGKLFGTANAVDSLVDKDNGLLVRAGTAIGNLHYSEQEKAGDEIKTREWGIRQLDALAPFKVVQRIIVFSVSFIWAFVIINLVAAIWIKAAWQEIDAVSMLWKLAISDVVFWPATMAFGLYLSGGVIKPSLFGRKGEE